MEAGKKILIVDDDARNRFALSAVLRAGGYTCMQAGSAAEGLDLLAQHSDIGIVLMDMMMPDMDGYQAIAAIRRDVQKANLPVIAVTAQAMVGDRQKCLQAGANDYVSKPIDVDILLGLLNKYLK
jgi:CheY-like chemotaxis protein